MYKTVFVATVYIPSSVFMHVGKWWYWILVQLDRTGPWDLPVSALMFRDRYIGSGLPYFAILSRTFLKMCNVVKYRSAMCLKNCLTAVLCMLNQVVL